jgi:hypothetical protein
MSAKWISIQRPSCGCAFAVSVASWAMAMARTMASPRLWWSSLRAVESLEGPAEAVDLLRRDHRPGVRDGDDGLVGLDPGGKLHPAAGHVEAHGAVQQVGDESFDQCRVARRWGVRDPGHQSGIRTAPESKISTLLSIARKQSSGWS